MLANRMHGVRKRISMAEEEAPQVGNGEAANYRAA
jgi:hypothetical protein